MRARGCSFPIMYRDSAGAEWWSGRCCERPATRAYLWSDGSYDVCDLHGLAPFCVASPFVAKQATPAPAEPFAWVQVVS